MKFIHTADIHWGMKPDSDKPWSRERAQDILDTFRDIIELTRSQKADCLFISGDLFHRQPSAGDLKEINYLFSTIAPVHVILIAGNHDKIQPNSALISFHWCRNVHVLMEETLTSVYLEDINTEVYGFSYHSSEYTGDPFHNLVIPDDKRIRVMLLHGGDTSHCPIDQNALAALDIAYFALGHIHKPAILIENRMAFAGSPEPLDPTETGEHGVYAGEISSLTRQITHLEFIPMARCQYYSLAVNVTDQTTNQELMDKILEEVEKRGRHNIYRFRIRGMRDPDITFDLSALDSRLKIAEAVDESEPQYDFSALFAEHPSDMIGFFIQELSKKDMSQIEKKALYYGINALLRTQNERS